MKMIVGIDEAGRGPVIGPLVVAGVKVKECDLDKLKQLGVKDSKLIAPKKRERMYEQIINIVEDYEILVIEPKEVDEALESDNLNLNWLEAIKSAMIINKLKGDKAIVDCPSNNIQAYTDYLIIYLKDKTKELICEHKADLNYISVSAASILAKVVRDRTIEKLKIKYGNIGSGYPSDPKTKRFLQENWSKYPELFRKTWSSYKVLERKSGQESLSNF